MIKINIGKINQIKLDYTTAYLAGVIIGDGHISNSTKSKKDQSKDYRIVVDITDQNYLRHISRLIKSIIITKSEPKKSKIRGKRQERLYFQIRNKSFFYFLTNDLNIPKGAKSRFVFVPDKIKNASLNIKKYFLAGIFDTDGGFRSKTLGFTSASQKLIRGLSIILNELSIKHYFDQWKNKKYNKTYFGIRLAKAETVKFLNVLPLQNMEKLQRIEKSSCGRAGVAKRDREFFEDSSKLRMSFIRHLLA